MALFNDAAFNFGTTGSTSNGNSYFDGGERGFVSSSTLGSSDGYPIGSSGGSYYGSLMDMINQANQANLANAQAAYAYNHHEAKLQRDWQERMSRHAHEYELEDLVRSGLNPILTAMGGNGASVPSGAAAHGVAANYESGVSAFASIIGSLISQGTALQVANINASTQLAAAKISAGKTSSTFNDISAIFKAVNKAVGSPIDLNNVLEGLSGYKNVGDKKLVW